MKEKYREMISYLICGIATTFVNLGVFWLCSQIALLPTAAATALAWAVSVMFAYLTNKTFVFCSSRKGTGALREMAVFFGARVFSGVMEVILMVLLVDVLCLPSFWTKIGVGVFVTAWNYLISKCFIFHREHQTGRDRREIKWQRV